MKRGVSGSLDLYKWQSEIRNGDQKGSAQCNDRAA